MKRFSEVWIGEWFESGGNVWRKRSSRTAEIIMSRTHDGNKWRINSDYFGKWFYFGKHETVNREYEWYAKMGAFDPYNQIVRAA